MIWKTILVPHDFSTHANRALAIARDEAKLHGATLALLHVIDLPHQLPPEAMVMPNVTGAPIGLKDYAIASTEAHLEDLVKRLAKDGITTTPYIRVGAPIDEINRFVTEMKIDLIVMGTSGRSGLAHLLIGSVAERIVRTSKVPVLTIR